MKKHGHKRILEVASHAILAVDQYFNDVHTGLLDVQSIARMHLPNWSDVGQIELIVRLINELGGLEVRIQDENVFVGAPRPSASLEGLYEALVACNELKDKNHVYWVERSESGASI